MGRYNIKEKSMTRFQPDLGKTKAGMPVYERGEYEVKILGVKPIYYVKEEEGTEVAGASLSLEMVGRVQNDGTLDRELEGETVAPLRLYVHSEKAWPITKRAIMAALGYTLDDEDTFNNDLAATLDVGVEPGEGDEEATLGSGWSRLTGQRMLMTLNKRKWQGREQQQHEGFMPIAK